jgi:hypothetical protein
MAGDTDEQPDRRWSLQIFSNGLLQMPVPLSDEGLAHEVTGTDGEHDETTHANNFRTEPEKRGTSTSEICVIPYKVRPPMQSPFHHWLLTGPLTVGYLASMVAHVYPIPSCTRYRRNMRPLIRSLDPCQMGMEIACVGPQGRRSKRGGSFAFYRIPNDDFSFYLIFTCPSIPALHILSSQPSVKCALYRS